MMEISDRHERRNRRSGSLAMFAVNAGKWVGCSTLAAEARADKRCCGQRLVPRRSLQCDQADEEGSSLISYEVSDEAKNSGHYQEQEHA